MKIAKGVRYWGGAGSKQWVNDYERARREHAFLLRCEGFNNYEIAQKISCLGELYIDDFIWEFSKRMRTAMRRARLRIQRC
jgi:hypothetical protein